MAEAPDWYRQLQVDGYSYIPGQGMATLDPRFHYPVVHTKDGAQSASDFWNWPPRQQTQPAPAAPAAPPVTPQGPIPVETPQPPAPGSSQTQQFDLGNWINDLRSRFNQGGGNRQSAFAGQGQNWQQTFGDFLSRFRRN